jgi:excisionase family DNA binding protein
MRNLLAEGAERRSAPKALEARILWRLLAERNAGVKSDGFPRLLTAGELAEQFGVPESWVREQARSGELPNIKLGSYFRFRLDEVKRTIEQTAGWESELEGAPTPPSLGVGVGLSPIKFPGSRFVRIEPSPQLSDVTRGAVLVDLADVLRSWTSLLWACAVHEQGFIFQLIIESDSQLSFENRRNVSADYGSSLTARRSFALQIVRA